MTLTADGIAEGKRRGISEGTLKALGVESGQARFGGEPVPSWVFPYRANGSVVNRKIRSFDSQHTRQTKGGEQQFWNLDAVLAGDMAEVWITEGELDALSLIEAGTSMDAVLSVPNGAPAAAIEAPEETAKFGYVLDALDAGLARAKRYVIATDNDGPGRNLRDNLVQLLGPAKCWFTEFPTGVKDANDALMQWGLEDLRTWLADAKMEWPVTGVYRLSEMPEPPPLELWHPGFEEWEKKVLLAPHHAVGVHGQARPRQNHSGATNLVRGSQPLRYQGGVILG